MDGPLLKIDGKMRNFNKSKCTSHPYFACDMIYEGGGDDMIGWGNDDIFYWSFT